MVEKTSRSFLKSVFPVHSSINWVRWASNEKISLFLKLTNFILNHIYHPLCTFKDPDEKENPIMYWQREKGKERVFVFMFEENLREK